MNVGDLRDMAKECHGRDEVVFEDADGNKGFEVEDNKRLGNDHTYWNPPIRLGRIV